MEWRIGNNLVITPDDLLASSSGMAVGTMIGIIVGAFLDWPLLLPSALGMVGLVIGTIVGRRRVSPRAGEH